MSHVVVPTEVGLDPVLPARLRELVAAQVAAGLTRGMQLYIARHGQPVVHEAIGVRGQDDLALQTSTRFNLFSASKPVTATALHMLVERGEVGYDDPVVRFLPEFGQHGKDGVTVGHLLLHQAGIPDGRQTVPVSAYSDFPDAIRRICALEPESGPGEITSYHVLTAMAVVAEIVQRVAGTDLRDFCARKLFGPLGMFRTTFGLPDDLADEATDTVGGIAERAVVADVWRSRTARLALHPAIGIHSTAEDLGRFYQAWLDGGAGLLTPTTVRQATSVHAPPGATSGFGYGFMVGTEPGEPSSRGSLCSDSVFGHPGMCSVQAYADPGAGLVVVLLANVDPGQEASDRRFSELCDAIQRAALGDSHRPRRPHAVTSARTASPA
jgi:CubicO group peptidase (beta-lactamase class C family)